jgi:hypothetical protein
MKKGFDLSVRNLDQDFFLRVAMWVGANLLMCDCLWGVMGPAMVELIWSS